MRKKRLLGSEVAVPQRWVRRDRAGVTLQHQVHALHWPGNERELRRRFDCWFFREPNLCGASGELAVTQRAA